jgi:hypothetical protein
LTRLIVTLPLIYYSTFHVDQIRGGGKEGGEKGKAFECVFFVLNQADPLLLGFEHGWKQE